MEPVEVVSSKPKEEEPEFVELVGQISLKSLDKAAQKKRQQQRQQRPGGPQGQGQGQRPQQNQGPRNQGKWNTCRSGCCSDPRGWWSHLHRIRYSPGDI